MKEMPWRRECAVRPEGAGETPFRRQTPKGALHSKSVSKGEY